MYIHSQIAALHEGVAHLMSTPMEFHNIAFIEPVLTPAPTTTVF